MPSSDVAARLRGTTGVQRVPDPRLELFVVRGFILPGERAALIGRIEGRRRPSTIADDIGADAYRTSETCDLDPADAVVGAVNARISALLGLDEHLGEPLQGQRYAPGQEFKAHTDTFEPGRADFFLNCADTGQRTWTAMAYLNDVEEGGATRFKTLGRTIQPEAGKLLAWNNLLDDGSPNPATLHQGMKVRRGIKYILTRWYRERPAPR